jgi:hypothetical protein
MGGSVAIDRRHAVSANLVRGSIRSPCIPAHNSLHYTVEEDLQQPRVPRAVTGLNWPSPSPRVYCHVAFVFSV